MAVVDRADSDAVPELGLPLNPHPSTKSVNRFSIDLHARVKKMEIRGLTVPYRTE